VGKEFFDRVVAEAKPWRNSMIVERVCLLLMLVLVGDVFLGVFSRYVMQATFRWYDEVARLCFVCESAGSGGEMALERGEVRVGPRAGGCRRRCS
jgi:hypothetical protein